MTDAAEFVYVTEDYTAKAGDICLVTTSADHLAIVVTLPETFVLPSIAVQPSQGALASGPPYYPTGLRAAAGFEVTVRYTGAEADTEGQYVQVYAQTDSSIDGAAYGALANGQGVTLVTGSDGVWHVVDGAIST